MSAVFNMIGFTENQNGSGSTADAVLLVYVPTGNTVSATKSGVTIVPRMWETNADSNRDVAIFEFSSSQFDSLNPWTVTSTDGSNVLTKTIVIDAAKVYNLTMRRYLYCDGDQCTVETGGWNSVAMAWPNGSGNALTVTAITGGVRLTQQQDMAYGIYCTKNAIDFTGFRTLRFTGTIYRDNIKKGMVALAAATSIGTILTNGYPENYVKLFVAPIGTTSYQDDIAFDVSDVNQPCYLYFYMVSSQEKYIDLNKLYLSV